MGQGLTNKPSAVVIPGITTASGYGANQAVGSAFRIPLANGEAGGALYTVTLLDQATANAALNLMLFSGPFTVTPNGTAFTLEQGDMGRFLGAVPIGTAQYVSAGTARSVATVPNPAVGVFSESGRRDLYGQLVNVTSGLQHAVVSAYTLGVTVLGD